MPAAFITVTELGSVVGEDLSADAGATFAVDGACDICRTFAEQDFTEVASETIVLDGTGTDALLLPQRPVTGVTTVVENDTTLVVTDDYKLGDNGVLLRMPSVDEDGNWYRTCWFWGRQNISVTYTHGYSSATLPNDLKVVALSIAARLWRSGSQGTTAEESLGAYRIRYVTNGNGAGSDLTKSELAILRKHKMSK